jgi:hypothetical protein
MKTLSAIFFCLLLSTTVHAEHRQYISPTDPINKTLNECRDLLREGGALNLALNSIVTNSTNDPKAIPNLNARFLINGKQKNLGDLTSDDFDLLIKREASCIPPDTKGVDLDALRTQLGEKYRQIRLAVILPFHRKVLSNFELSADDIESLKAFKNRYADLIQPTDEIIAEDAALKSRKAEERIRDAEQRKAEEARIRQANEASHEQLQSFTAEITALPDSGDAVSKLKEIESRVKTLRDVPVRTKILESLEVKSETIFAVTRKKKCAALADKGGLSKDLQDIRLNYPGMELTFAEFLCGAFAAGMPLQFAPDSEDANILRIKMKTFKIDFLRGRLLPDGQTFVTNSSPIIGGTPALAFSQATNTETGEKETAWAFLIILYQGWEPQMNAYLQQQP